MDTVHLKFGQGGKEPDHPLAPYQNDLLHLLNGNLNGKASYSPPELADAFQLLPPGIQSRIINTLRLLTPRARWARVLSLGNLSLYEEAADLRIALLRARSVSRKIITEELIRKLDQQVIQPSRERGLSFESVVALCEAELNKTYPSLGARFKDECASLNARNITPDHLLAIMLVNLALFQEGWQKEGLKVYSHTTVIEEAKEAWELLPEVPIDDFRKDMLEPEAVGQMLQDPNMESWLPLAINGLGRELLRELDRRAPKMSGRQLLIAQAKHYIRSAIHYTHPQITTATERKRISKLAEMIELAAQLIQAMPPSQQSAP